MRAEHKGARRPSALPNFDDCLSGDRPRLRRMARDLSSLSHCGANKAKMREIMRGSTKPKRIHEG